MFCKYCGNQIHDSGVRFCPTCGKEINQSSSTSGVKRISSFPYKPVMIGLGAALVVLMFVLVLRPSGTTLPSEPEANQPEEPQITIVGDWVTEEGIGLTFTEDGLLRVKGGDLSLGGDMIHYSIKNESTLYLSPEDAFLGVGFDVHYTLTADELFLEVDDVTIRLKRQ